MRVLPAVLVLIVYTGALAQDGALQQTSAAGVSTQAMTGTTLFARFVSSAGWSSTRKPSQVHASGTIERLDTEGDVVESAPFEYTGSADGTFRIDVNHGIAVTEVSASGASAIINTKRRRVPVHVVLGMNVPLFPFVSDNFQAGSQPKLSDSAEPKVLEGGTAVGVQFSCAAVNGDISSSVRQRLFEKTYWISVATGQLVQVDAVRLGDDNWSATFPYSLRYSDWRIVSGVLVPFAVEELVDGKRLFRYRFATVELGGVNQ